jgi:hypothetical protein
MILACLCQWLLATYSRVEPLMLTYFKLAESAITLTIMLNGCCYDWLARARNVRSLSNTFSKPRAN